MRPLHAVNTVCDINFKLFHIKKSPHDISVFLTRQLNLGLQINAAMENCCKS